MLRSLKTDQQTPPPKAEPDFSGFANKTVAETHTRQRCVCTDSAAGRAMLHRHMHELYRSNCWHEDLHIICESLQNNKSQKMLKTISRTRASERLLKHRLRFWLVVSLRTDLMDSFRRPRKSQNLSARPSCKTHQDLTLEKKRNDEGQSSTGHQKKYCC